MLPDKKGEDVVEGKEDRKGVSLTPGIVAGHAGYFGVAECTRLHHKLERHQVVAASASERVRDLAFLVVVFFCPFLSRPVFPFGLRNLAQIG